MKKNYSIFNTDFIRNAILMVLATALLTACEDDGPKSEDDFIFDTEEYSVPTADEFNVVSDLPAYVLPYDYQNFGAAFVNRMQNKVTVVNDEIIDDLSTVVLHSSQVKNISDEWSVILLQLLLGRNIVIIEPTIDDFKYY